MSARAGALERIGIAMRVLSGVGFASADDFHSAVDAVAQYVRDASTLVETARADCAVLVAKLQAAESTAHDHCQARVEQARAEGFADGLRHAAGQLDYLAAKLRNQAAP